MSKLTDLQQPQVGASIAFNSIAIALTAFDNVMKDDEARKLHITKVLVNLVYDTFQNDSRSLDCPYDDTAIQTAIHHAEEEIRHDVGSSDVRLAMSVMRVIGYERSHQRPIADATQRRTTPEQELCLATTGR